jgi:chorismate dehydratase
MAVRIGGVPFGVGAPLLHGLDREPGVELVTAPPAELVRRLRRGGLDAALVSSIEAWRQPGYRVVAELGIAADGPIRTVRAFRRPGVPVRTIAADRGSETSIALLKTLLARRPEWFGGAQVRAFERVDPGPAPDAFPHDLVLLIGDHGRDAAAGARDVLDLGELWQRYCGLPFVFALWLLAPHADAVRVLALLRGARERSKREGVDDGTRGAARYELGRREWQGLERFRTEAAALGLVDPAVAPTRVGHEPP